MIKSPSINQLGEFGLINALTKSLPQTGNVIRAAGDDTAVLKYTAKAYQLLTTDMIAEGVHFKRGTAPLSVGHKALACNISDIASMGGRPTFAVVSIAVPRNYSQKALMDMYKGMNQLAQTFGVSIVGGDTITAHQFVINIALLGEVEKKNLILRKGASQGDWIFTTGPLGRAWKTDKHLTFTPRVAEARFLVTHFKPSAMIDVSDGLAADLNHILEQSGVGAKLLQKHIPLNPGASLQEALSDGEDFELVFTLHPQKAQALIQWQQRQRRWFFYPIGEIVSKKGLSLYTTGHQIKPIPVKGFTHF